MVAQLWNLVLRQSDHLNSSYSTSPESERLAIVNPALSDTGAEWVPSEITKTWPCKYDPIDLSASTNEVAFGTLGSCHERFGSIDIRY